MSYCCVPAANPLVLEERPPKLGIEAKPFGAKIGLPYNPSEKSVPPPSYALGCAVARESLPGRVASPFAPGRPPVPNRGAAEPIYWGVGFEDEEIAGSTSSPVGFEFCGGLVGSPERPFEKRLSEKRVVWTTFGLVPS